jgi:hypothetical protein
LVKKWIALVGHPSRTLDGAASYLLFIRAQWLLYVGLEQEAKIVLWGSGNLNQVWTFLTVISWLIRKVQLQPVWKVNALHPDSEEDASDSSDLDSSSVEAEPVAHVAHSQ